MENFVYKYIDVDNLDQVLREIKSFHKFKNFTKPNFYNMSPEEVMPHLPTLNEWFIKKNLKPKYIAHIGQLKRSSQAVHIDTGDNDLALNFPIDVVHEAYTVFFKNKGELKTAYTPNTNVKYSVYVDLDPIEIGRYVLDKPALLNIKNPHAIRNKSITNDRYCFSFRFVEDPWHLI